MALMHRAAFPPRLGPEIYSPSESRCTGSGPSRPPRLHFLDPMTASPSRSAAPLNPPRRRRSREAEPRRALEHLLSLHRCSSMCSLNLLVLGVGQTEGHCASRRETKARTFVFQSDNWSTVSALVSGSACVTLTSGGRTGSVVRQMDRRPSQSSG